MEQFRNSFDAASTYPKNLVHQNGFDYNLDAYVQRLDEREGKLFCEDSRVSLDFWECDDQGRDFRSVCVKREDDLKKHLLIGMLLHRNDPRCRFVFVHAPHSRERLRTTRKMLLLTLSYHQVIPSFLEFIFPFGRQLYAQDIHFSGFREENRLMETDRGSHIPELGRSGRDIRLCYNLKSVEPSDGQRNLPWSLRQTAVYHSFDIEMGQAFWMIVKGDKLMKDRITSVMDSPLHQDLSSFDTIAKSFASSLATHLVVCEWAGEHWRWYISYLEEQLQATTGSTVSLKVHKPSEIPTEIRPFSPQPLSQRTTLAQTEDDLTGPISENPSFSSRRTFSWLTKKSRSPMSPTEPEHAYSPQLQSRTSTFGCLPQANQRDHAGKQNFSFVDLQRTQFIKEKATEALLVLRANGKVLEEIKQHYQSFIGSESCPNDLRTGCIEEINKFVKLITRIEKDLRMQQSRLKALLSLLSDRKSLLYGILEYRNMEANIQLAQETRASAQNMETMTHDMHIIALKTKQETISMRIITLVTLFFLPGTFISTLMSTDIVRFPPASAVSEPLKKVVSMDALQLFMAICIPMMVLTFIGWYVVYWLHNRKDRPERKRLEAGVFKSAV